MNRWHQLLTVDLVTLHQAATDDAIRRAEAAINRRLPPTLRALYRTTDGIYDQAGQWFVIWPLSRVITEASETWAPPGPLIAFGDNGAGEPFCVTSGEEGVSLWHPIDGELEPLANDTYEFWRNWTNRT
ncbi:SMI1/KNR4 family protein [Nocardioides sp. NPDC057772]|uniref:SMI1/KNR4 family protein n=1 Tax=Nocardioides sp. NPDC057772 TaxID=3346245 RepID=UPI003670E5BD